MDFAEKFSRGSQGQERALLGLCIYQNTTEKLPHLHQKKLLHFYLVVQGRVQLEHSSHIVKVSVEATCQHSNP